MRKRAFSLLLILPLLSCIDQTVSGAATNDRLAPAGSMEMPFTIGPSPFATTLWTNGAFVVVEDRYSVAPLLRFFDSNGAQVSQFKFSIPGASRINIYDNSVALGLDKALAIVGTYLDDSRGAMFVAWVSPDRQHQTVIRTNPFFPAAVTIASDGTIWVAGHEAKQQNEERDYSRPLIRRYDKTGTLLGSFVPWSSLELDKSILPFAGSTLLPLRDGVLWYCPRAHLYFEIYGDGSVINRFKSAPHPEPDIADVAVCDGGGVFASTQIRDNSGSQIGWGVFALDRERGEWTLIPRGEKWAVLYGCDGTRLATTTDFRTISWLETKTK